MASAICLMAAFDESRRELGAGDEARSLDAFLRGVERRALRMAELATGSRDEALDLVQDAMFGFVRHYGGHDGAEWPPLFWRVLDSRLNDWHRRQKVRGRWSFRPDDKDTDEDPIDARN